MHRIALVLLICASTSACKKSAEKTPTSTAAATGTTADAGGASTTAADAAGGTEGSGSAAAATGSGSAAARSATATLEARSKSNVKGTVKFREVEGGVEVTANVEGLTPGDHAYHVHEKGDCSAPDATSAGGHFNPGNHPHGAPDAEARHAGDFGNLTADKDGKATKTFVMKGITLAEGTSSIIGKGFIVHEKADDLKTQPTGNAGGRVACGVIQTDM